MLDICMCMNDQCPQKETCYRYRAKPDDYYTYAHFNMDNKEKCKHYLDLKEWS